MRLALCSLLFLFLTIATLQSASTQTEKNPAQKLDEFGDIPSSDLMARLDNLAIALQNQPNTNGFIVIYRTRRDLAGLNHTLAMRMKDYLVNNRGISTERLVNVDGGIAENLVQELWIVPSGSAPTPRSDARIGYLEDPDTAWKFNEYGFLPIEQYRKLGAIRNRVTKLAEAEYLEAYANEVKKRQNQIACIIVYAQYNPHPRLVDYVGYYEPISEVRLDPPATARKQLMREKRYLMQVYGLPAATIKTIDGGYRKRRSIEYWIVPQGEPLPIATPNSFPPRRKHHK
jgi:hypothetical protein